MAALRLLRVAARSWGDYGREADGPRRNGTLGPCYRACRLSRLCRAQAQPKGAPQLASFGLQPDWIGIQEDWHAGSRRLKK